MVTGFFHVATCFPVVVTNVTNFFIINIYIYIIYRESFNFFCGNSNMPSSGAEQHPPVEQKKATELSWHDGAEVSPSGLGSSRSAPALESRIGITSLSLAHRVGGSVCPRWRSRKAYLY